MMKKRKQSKLLEKCILYIDDLEEVRHNIEKIFGKAETFPIQMT